jgi:hypothetical protein
MLKASSIVSHVVSGSNLQTWFMMRKNAPIVLIVTSFLKYNPEIEEGEDYLVQL